MAKSIKRIESFIKKGPYQDTWQSLSKKVMTPWFNQQKFGIFIHWGLYSIPAFNNEWYSRNMYIQGSEEYLHHIKTYQNHKNFGYQHFIDLFKAPLFDSNQWADIISSSGAKYAFMVAEHHDGFQMYQSDISIYNSFDKGPKKDILGELKIAFEKKDIAFCASSHRAEHWFFMSHGKSFESDIKEPLKKGDFYWPSMPEQDHYDFESTPAPSKEFLEDWLMRTVEIIDKYFPKILYFDWWIQHQAFKPYLKKLAAYYYNLADRKNEEVMIAYKHDAFLYETGIMQIERGKFNSLKHFTWQTETAIANNSWCYTETLEYKNLYDVIVLLMDVISKNGNLLLNIGPKGDGSIPSYEINLLHDLGKWISINQDAIYESKPYHVFGEGLTQEDEGKFSEKQTVYGSSDFRFTVNHGYVYVAALNPLNQDTFYIKTLKKATKEDPEGLFSLIKDVSLLGSETAPLFEHQADYLVIKTKDKQGKLPIVFKIEIT